MIVKPITWLADSRERLREFSDEARGEIPRSGVRASYLPEEGSQGTKGGYRLGQDTIQGTDSREEATMSTKLKITRGSGNVFLDVGFSPSEAANLKLRAQLMDRVCEAAQGATQRDAAKRFGITQPRLNDLLRGRINKFSLDALVNMLGNAGMRVELRVKKAA